MILLGVPRQGSSIGSQVGIRYTSIATDKGLAGTEHHGRHALGFCNNPT